MINYYALVRNNPDYFKQFSCKDLLFLNYDCPVGERRIAKWSEYHYVYYVLSGKKSLQTIEGKVTLTEGSIAFVRKGACIAEQYFDEAFCVVVFIIPDSFIISFLDEYLPGEKPADKHSRLIIPIVDDFNISNFYKSILPYFASADKIPDALLELKFKELMLSILHNPDNEELRTYFLQLRNQSTSSINEIMEVNYPYNLSLEDYAKLTNRSVSSFKRDFYAVYKTTPGRWLIEKKIARAKELLIQTDKPIAHVSLDSGFENTAHFSRLFKQKTGITPLEFRKKAYESVEFSF